MKNMNVYTSILFYIFLVSCSQSNDEDIKYGYTIMDSNINIGAAFEKYPYFKKISWSTCSEENGQKIIQVIGEYDLEKIRRTAPLFISPIESATFASLLNAAKHLSPDSLNAQYMVQFTRGEERAGKLFQVAGAGFVFSSPDQNINKAVDALRVETKDAELQGLRDIYSGNTAAIQVMMGAIELASRTPGYNIYRPIGSFNP